MPSAEPSIRMLLCLIALSAAAATASAQETYTLGEDDTWTPTTSAEAGTPAERLAHARRALAHGEFERAAQLASTWIERFPRDPMLPDAYLVRADALLGQKEHYQALFDYEFIARGYPGSEAFVTSLQRELEIARLFASGTRRKLWGLRVIDASSEAEELLIRIQERMPGSRLAEEAGIELADFYFRRRDMSLAAEAYALFIENYPKSSQISKARRRLIYANLAAFKGPQFDAAGLREADARLAELQIVEPASAQDIGADAIRARIGESTAQKVLTTAKWYLAIGDVVSAEFTIRRLLKKHPRSAAAAEALQMMPSILPRLPATVRAKAPDYEALLKAMDRSTQPATQTNPAPQNVPQSPESAPKSPPSAPAAEPRAENKA